MTTDNLYTIVNLLDTQLSKVSMDASNKGVVDHLLELRNNILLEVRPDTNFKWTIKNKIALKVVDFFDYQISWTQ